MATKRQALLNKIDADFRRKFDDKGVNSYKGFYDDALALMKSKELKAFDLADESEKQREIYGNNSFGQGCLLARRLVGSGVRFVEVKHDGWDHHKALADEMSEVAPVFDQAFATLITDLEQRGLLDSTLVVVATIRKPAFDGDGRSHHPVCFSTVSLEEAQRLGLFMARATIWDTTLTKMPFLLEHFTPASHSPLVWKSRNPPCHLLVGPCLSVTRKAYSGVIRVMTKVLVLIFL